MPRGPIYESGYKPQFSGHETFPLRYGWLKKAFDAIGATEKQSENRWVFLRDDAIARFGVGKNMVAAMRYWANAAGVIEESSSSGQIRTTEFGRKLFGEDGLDPFMEHPASLWLIHWKLAARPEKTTWYWAFNYYPNVTFDREHLVKGLDRVAGERGWSRVATSTIKNDVACFVRTYVPQEASGLSGNDDALESPLTELGLIKAIGRRDGFRLVRGPKSTLGDGVFVSALLDFWSQFSKSATLSFEAIAHEPGGPGRVFLLEENDVMDRLVNLDDITRGALRWSETAGLKQVVRDREIQPGEALRFIDGDYARRSQREAA